LELNALIFVKGVGEEDILSKHLDVNDYQLLNLDYGMARHYKKISKFGLRKVRI